MLRNSIVALLSLVAMALATPASAQKASFGSAAEARTMIERATAALKSHETQAIERFNKRDGEFRDRDLYLFCFMMKDGRVVAHVRSDQIGLDVRTVKDATGKPFGSDLYNAAKENEVAEVRYAFPRPGSTTPEAKISFVTRVGNVGCGVGYYP